MDNQSNGQGDEQLGEKKTVLDFNDLQEQNLNFIEKVSGLEKYFLQIEDWLSQDKGENKPLVIQGEQGFGKKTLLVKWQEYHTQNKIGRNPDLILFHFATLGGNNSNYFFALYRILIKLREALNITQKVELLEEKLRRYFAYWLDLSNKELEQQIVKNAGKIYDKVIIVFEGIDSFHEQNDVNCESNVAFWLPRVFPQRIKVIVTCDSRSTSMNHFKTIKCQILTLVNDTSIAKNMIETHMSRETFVSESRRNQIKNLLMNMNQASIKQTLFVRTFLSILIPYPTYGIVSSEDVDQTEIEKLLEKLDVGEIKKVQNIEELMSYILDFFQANLFEKDKFQQLLTLLTITQKGLTLQEIKDICRISTSEWFMFLVFFKLFLMHFRDLWIINNEIFKLAVFKKYHKSGSQILELHEKTADAIERNTPNSIRKLEEQTFHLFRSRSYFKLKEVISIIENFLLLFNPNNKYDLCRYWQVLEEHGFDPVLEYNKAVEGFQIHYHPTAEDIFRIIIQISRFLKEFGDFETINTPDFRHPAIVGQEKELQDIGLFREILVLDMYFNVDPELKSFKRMEGNSLDPQQKLEQKMDLLKQKQNRLKKGQIKQQNEEEEDQNKKKKQVEEKRGKIQKAQVLSEMESLNVEIPQNRELIRDSLLEKMLVKDEIKDKDQNTEADDQRMDTERLYNQAIINYFSDIDNIRVMIKSKIDSALIQTQKSLSLEAEENEERISTDYYYKRWIWIQFPWACMTLQNDYSVIIKQCFSSATNYMKVEEEQAFTNQALKIAIEAKLKKQKMYERNTTDESASFSIAPKSRKQAYNLSQDFLSHQSSVPSLPNISSHHHNHSIVSMNSLKSSKFNGKDEKTFFITQDYLNMNLLNKQLQEQSMETMNKSLEKSIITRDGETTIRMIEKSQSYKNRIQGYKASNVTLNSYDVTEVFPTIKNQMNKHTGRELYALEQQARIMRKELDSLIYQNGQLAKELKFQKVLEFNKGYVKKEQANFENLRGDLRKLENNVNTTEEEYRYSTLAKERIKTILKICKDNKQQNEDWIRVQINYCIVKRLNYLINNLKKLIKFEEADIVRNKEQINQLKRIIEEFLITYSEKMKHQQNLIHQIKNSIDKKKKLDQMFQESDSVIQDQAIKTIQLVKSNQKGQDMADKQRIKQSQYEKNARLINEKLEAYQQDYHRLQSCFDIKDPTYTQSPDFQKFLQNLDKKRELEGSLMQQKQKLLELENVKLQKEQLLKTYQSANQNEQKEETKEQQSSDEEEDYHLTEDQKREQESELEMKQRDLEHLLKMKLDCMMALTTLSDRLAKEQRVQNPNNQYSYSIQKVCEMLKQKKDTIVENMGEQSYKSICEGTYDINAIYKSILPYHMDPILANKEVE